LNNQTLNLELAGLIVSMDLIPDFSDIDFYKQQLKETFNHDYEKIEIQNSLELLLGQQVQEELLVYPDDHINGI